MYEMSENYKGYNIGIRSSIDYLYSSECFLGRIKKGNTCLQIKRCVENIKYRAQKFEELYKELHLIIDMVEILTKLSVEEEIRKYHEMTMFQKIIEIKPEVKGDNK